MPREKPRLYKEDIPKMKRFVLIDDSLTINLVVNAKGDVIDIEYYHNDEEVIDALEPFLTQKQVRRIIDEGGIIEVLAEVVGVVLVKDEEQIGDVYALDTDNSTIEKLED